jgi:hypothetical protein
MVLNATFNNISAISWRSILLVEETVSEKIIDLKYYCILSTITWNICIIYGIHVSTLFDIRRSGGGVVAVIVW